MKDTHEYFNASLNSMEYVKEKKTALFFLNYLNKKEEKMLESLLPILLNRI